MRRRAPEVAHNRRWPAWVYETGSEPDYRFSFANERTFLAWIRTALALVAAGVALDAVDVGLPGTLERLLAAFFVALGLLASLAAWVRWARAERSIRRGEPLPAQQFAAVLTAAVVLVAVAVLVLLV
jgi:putative membrane protein